MGSEVLPQSSLSRSLFLYCFCPFFPVGPVVGALYDGASKTLFACVCAFLADLVVLDLVLVVHEEVSVCEADPVEIFCNIQLFIHIASVLIR